MIRASYSATFFLAYPDPLPRYHISNTNDLCSEQRETPKLNRKTEHFSSFFHSAFVLFPSAGGTRKWKNEGSPKSSWFSLAHRSCSDFSDYCSGRSTTCTRLSIVNEEASLSEPIVSLFLLLEWSSWLLLCALGIYDYTEFSFLFALCEF
jgi:hypothetical protein